MGLSYSKPPAKRELKRRQAKKNVSKPGGLTLENGQDHLEILQQKKNNRSSPATCMQTQPTVSRKSSKMDNCNINQEFQQYLKVEQYHAKGLHQRKEREPTQIQASIYSKKIPIVNEKLTQPISLAPISFTNKPASTFSIQSINQKPNFSLNSNPIGIDSVRLSFNSHQHFPSETDQEPILPKPSFLSKTMTFSNKFAEMQRNLAQHNGKEAKRMMQVRRSIIGKRSQM